LEAVAVNDIMREIQASEAKVQVLQLIEDVERGETPVITRDGRRIARLVPDVDQGQAEIDAAVNSIGELRERTGKISLDQLMSARD
jgi:prevent-host-death family protein